MLARIPVFLLRDFGGALDEYAYAWVETLQSFWLHNRDDLRTHLVRAVDLSAPEPARVVTAEEMSKIRYPPIMVLYRYLRNDPAGFNEALADAVRWHKEYWTADETKRQRFNPRWPSPQRLPPGQRFPTLSLRPGLPPRQSPGLRAWLSDSVARPKITHALGAYPSALVSPSTDHAPPATLTAVARPHSQVSARCR